MSTATATAAPAPTAARGKKKLIVIIAVVLVLLIAGGAGALLLLKKPPVDEFDDELAEDRPAATASAQRKPGGTPTYVPLDVFTVNLADRESERFAQVGITLEVSDAKLGDQIKLYMPAIRNRILLAIADRTAAELNTRPGKERLAERVAVETGRALGFDLPEPSGAQASDAPPQPSRRRAEVVNPITAVHFSNFIVQ